MVLFTSLSLFLTVSFSTTLQLMAKMGLDAYRFSISWLFQLQRVALFLITLLSFQTLFSLSSPHMSIDGKGAVNPKGVQYYSNLINELISHGIQPHVTLHHHDLPQALEDDYGGWVCQRIIKGFTAYADLCFKEFGDRVRYWTTINEDFFIGWYFNPLVFGEYPEQ